MFPTFLRPFFQQMFAIFCPFFPNISFFIFKHFPLPLRLYSYVLPVYTGFFGKVTPAPTTTTTPLAVCCVQPSQDDECLASHQHQLRNHAEFCDVKHMGSQQQYWHHHRRWWVRINVMYRPCPFQLALPVWRQLSLAKSPQTAALSPPKIFLGHHIWTKFSRERKKM